MATPNGSPDKPRREFDDLGISRIISTSAYHGMLSGGVGVLVGSVAGIIRSPNPVLFSAASGGLCFGLGAVFSATRQCLVDNVLLHPAYHGNSRPEGVPLMLSQRQQTVASTVSGAVAGASMGGITRGRANVLPGAIFWGLAGLAGQELWNARERAEGRLSDESVSGPKDPFWVRWSPMRKLSDDEYEVMLKERLLRVNTEIAIIDEDIAQLKDDQAKIDTGNKEM